MNKLSEDTFWADSEATTAVERRVEFPLPSHPQLTVSILPGQPVPDAALLSEPMIEATVIEPIMLKTGSIAPQLIYGTVRQSTHDDSLVVPSASGREFNLIQAEPSISHHVDPMDYEQQMKNAAVATPAAQVTAGDHVVGFLFRTDVIHFYPLAVVTLPEEIESFHDGSATTSDVMPMLPFQS